MCIRDRVWEFLNEPVVTDYALPSASKGLPGAAYTVDDYIALLKLASAAMKRADPDCVVIGGLSSGPLRLTREFIRGGGLELVDVLNLHIYPGFARPEGFIGPMSELRRMMDQHGRRRPIWITEYSYYGCDDLPYRPYIPPSHSWAGNRLLSDERECAEYAVKFAVIMLSAGVQKIFYHAGTSGEVNDPSLECCLLGYAGLPRKVYAAQAALADMLGPAPRFAGRLAGGVSEQAQPAGLYGFAFQTDQHALLVAWADLELAGEGWRLELAPHSSACDIVGRPIAGSVVALDETPVYVVSRSMPAGSLLQRCRLLPPDK